jgi:hypothetical protein
MWEEHIPEELASSIPSVTSRIADSMILGMTPHGEHETLSQLPLGAKVCSTSSQSTGDCGCLEDFMIVAAKKNNLPGSGESHDHLHLSLSL